MCVCSQTSGGRDLNGVLKQPIDRLESRLYVTLKITLTLFYVGLRNLAWAFFSCQVSICTL